MKKNDEVRRLYTLLRDYDQREVAEVGARVRAACCGRAPADAEERALAITLDVLRLRGSQLHRARDEREWVSPPYGGASRGGDGGSA